MCGQGWEPWRYRREIQRIKRDLENLKYDFQNQAKKKISEIIEIEVVENALESRTKRQRPKYEKK